VPGVPDAVRAFLDQDGEQVVLASPAAPALDLDGVPVLALPQPTAKGRYARVLVSVADRADLRAAVLPHGVRAPVVAVWIAALASCPGLVARPEWPPMRSFRAQPVADGYLVVARFEQPVRAANVVRELGRLAVWPAPGGGGGLVVDDGSGPSAPVDDRDVPPDLVMAPSGPLAEHPVTGRAPIPVPRVGGPFSVGPLDERVLNPIGFEADVDGPVVGLESLTAERPGGLPADEGLVRSLRPALGVQGGSLEDTHAARLVAGLAMAGVPVSVTSVGPAVASLLGEAVTAALTAPVRLDDALAREEHSVVLRRAALRAFSTRAWSRQAARLAGVRIAGEPTVSVVLATRRPEMLGFALRQVRKQRDVELQLVLAPHGFSPDAGEVRELAGPGLADRVVVRPHDESVLFGDVLAGAVAAADGDLVLKMDDDDWYGADFVSDLLLARGYSGAELVGTPSELHYLVPKDVTVRRGHRAELYARFVAGGTMLIDRGLLREVGSFRPVRRYVDAQLLNAVVRTGAAIYRTHGLGYLLRRNATGHTWQVDMDYLLDPVRVAEIRPGFSPSRLLSHDPSELP
jgi:hypothetical protein